MLQSSLKTAQKQKKKASSVPLISARTKTKTKHIIKTTFTQINHFSNISNHFGKFVIHGARIIIEQFFTFDTASW